MWRPSKKTKPTPVKTCQSQPEVAFGSFANGLSIELPSKDFQRRDEQRHDGHEHQDAEDGFVRLHAYVKARQRHAQAVEPVNEYAGDQNDIERQEVRANAPARRRRPMISPRASNWLSTTRWR